MRKSGRTEGLVSRRRKVVNPATLGYGGDYAYRFINRRRIIFILPLAKIWNTPCEASLIDPTCYLSPLQIVMLRCVHLWWRRHHLSAQCANTIKAIGDFALSIAPSVATCSSFNFATTFSTAQHYGFLSSLTRLRYSVALWVIFQIKGICSLACPLAQGYLFSLIP